MKKFGILILFVFLFGCSQIVLEPVDFSWPIESVLDVSDDGIVNEARFSFSANVKALFFEEFNDSTSYKKESVRIIRDSKGYYFMIGSGFKNVYVFNANNGTFSLENKIEVAEFGLDLPAFNQRVPYVELLEGEKHVAYLTSEGKKGE
ncbi:MAG: hypothetical protein IPM32_15855 [Ignavibacteriae bacterium]|nr:hypothetical protein [Ignavibacteriota bacterium]